MKLDIVWDGFIVLGIRLTVCSWSMMHSHNGIAIIIISFIEQNTPITLHYTILSPWQMQTPFIFIAPLLLSTFLEHHEHYVQRSILRISQASHTLFTNLVLSLLFQGWVHQEHMCVRNSPASPPRSTDLCVCCACMHTQRSGSSVFWLD